MKLKLCLCAAISLGLLSGCSAIEPEATAVELVKSGCANYLSSEGLNYFRQAADLDEKYRDLVKSVSALQINLAFTKSENVAPEVKRTLALKMLEDLAVKNSFC